jgi:hypothetical protein
MQRQHWLWTRHRNATTFWCGPPFKRFKKLATLSAYWKRYGRSTPRRMGVGAPRKWAPMQKPKSPRSHYLDRHRADFSEKFMVSFTDYTYEDLWVGMSLVSSAKFYSFLNTKIHSIPWAKVINDVLVSPYQHRNKQSSILTSLYSCSYCTSYRFSKLRDAKLAIASITSAPPTCIALQATRTKYS